jgi:uncharacterized repeat protein (TIGR03803 family)
MLTLRRLTTASVVAAHVKAHRALVFAIVLAPMLVTTQSLRAQTFTVLHRFKGGADGNGPEGLVGDAKGNFYGVTCLGGTSDSGTVFKLRGKKETVLYRFTGGSDGFCPVGSLLYKGGMLFGVTSEGGGICQDQHECGTVFKLDNARQMTTLYRFTGGVDGDYPNGALVRDAAGNLYGTTGEGGASSCQNSDGTGCGTVFKVDMNGSETVLYNFTGGADGWFPNLGLVWDAAGNLYGTTNQGGDLNCGQTDGCGVVFKLDKSRVETVLHTFTNGDGAQSQAGVIRDTKGALYGTTGSGGNLGCDPGFGCGVVFKLGKTGKETVLHRFRGKPDGSVPLGGLLRDAQGSLYGTTVGGGAFGFGTVFKIDTVGRSTVLHSFSGGADGAFPQGAGLIMDTSGSLYGTTLTGGDLSCHRNLGCGVVFKLTP